MGIPTWSPQCVLAGCNKPYISVDSDIDDLQARAWGHCSSRVSWPLADDLSPYHDANIVLQTLHQYRLCIIIINEIELVPKLLRCRTENI